MSPQPARPSSSKAPCWVSQWTSSGEARGSETFQVLPKRWIVERTFFWLMLHRRLIRDYATHWKTSRAMIFIAVMGVTSPDLTGQATPSWRDPTAPQSDI